MRWWPYKHYSLWVINTDKEAFLYKWDNWRQLIPSIDKLLLLTNERAFIRTKQSFEFENKWLGFGRMAWNEENNMKWTKKYRTSENESRLNFYDTEIWAPDWNNFIKTGMPPEIFVKLYNIPNSQTTKEGLIIAMPRRLSLNKRPIIETELSRLTNRIPNSTLITTTRLWQPWFKFSNSIDNINPFELEKIIKEGK